MLVKWNVRSLVLPGVICCRMCFGFGLLCLVVGHWRLSLYFGVCFSGLFWTLRPSVRPRVFGTCVLDVLLQRMFWTCVLDV